MSTGTPLSLRLDEDLRARLDRLADMTGEKMSDLLRDVLKRGIVLRENDEHTVRQAFAEAAVDCLGILREAGASSYAVGALNNIKTAGSPAMPSAWRLIRDEVRSAVAENDDGDVVVFENELIRRVVGATPKGGYRAPAMSCVRELIGEERYNEIWHRA